MSEIIDEVIAGIVVAILSGIGGFLVRKRFFRENRILPRRPRKREKESYSHLNGEWYLYFLTRDSSVSSEPFWARGIEEIRVTENNQVVGTSHLVHHPTPELDYEVHGEIRYGRMILTDNCVQDETEFASLIFPNLRSAAILIGIWTGFDNDVHLMSAPAILSRTEMTEGELNDAVKKSTMSLAPAGLDYNLYQRQASNSTRAEAMPK